MQIFWRELWVTIYLPFLQGQHSEQFQVPYIPTSPSRITTACYNHSKEGWLQSLWKKNTTKAHIHTHTSMEVLLFPNGTGSQWCSVENPYDIFDDINLEENGENADYHCPCFGEAGIKNNTFLGFIRFLYIWRASFTLGASTF